MRSHDDTTTYSTVEVTLLIGATYRQVDYWAREGKIPGMASSGSGQGKARRWTHEQIDVARELKRQSDVRRLPLGLLATG